MEFTKEDINDLWIIVKKEFNIDIYNDKLDISQMNDIYDNLMYIKPRCRLLDKVFARLSRDTNLWLTYMKIPKERESNLAIPMNQLITLYNDEFWDMVRKNGGKM